MCCVQVVRRVDLLVGPRVHEVLVDRQVCVSRISYKGVDAAQW